MSCNEANNCKKYKMNIGNPNPHQSPCNNCKSNISDYEIGYRQGRADAIKEIEDKVAEWHGLSQDGWIPCQQVIDFCERI